MKEKQNESQTKGERKVKIEKAAVAGTLESSDAMVTVEAAATGIEVDINSTVIHQYGEQIEKVVMETLTRMEVQGVRVSIVDKGALDCTLKARVECAVNRANGISEGIDWGGVIR